MYLVTKRIDFCYGHRLLDYDGICKHPHGHNAVVDEIEGMTVLSLRGLTRSRSSLLLKRAIDVAGALAGLVVLAPLLVGVAALIKLTSRGPVLYRQERAGRGGEPFRMLKFRTMVPDADGLKPALLHLNEADGVMFKISDDPRLTRFGRVLRRTSVDELPQLWNVLRGEMSLVGPRPIVQSEVARYGRAFATCFAVPPGVTGLWHVSGRSDTSYSERVALDLDYASRWSLRRDIAIMLRTVPAVLAQRGSK